MHRFTVIVPILAVLAAPVVALAQATDTATQLQSLLAEVQALEQQLTALQQGSSSGATTAPAPAPSSSAACPALSRSLSLGSSGADVLALQQYLVAQGLLPAGDATGLYDATTEQAVQQWQSSHGIVSSGTPETTGYGLVGPRTRSMITLNCSASASAASQACPLAPQPSTPCAGSWSAITNSNGCTLAWTCSVPLASLLSGSSTATSSGASVTPTQQCNALSLSCPAGEHDQITEGCMHTCVAD